MDSKIAAALLDAVTTAALDAALTGKADANMLSTVGGGYSGGQIGHSG